MRAVSDFPASLRFEWTSDPNWERDIQRSEYVDATQGPRTARHSVVVSPDENLYWRVRCRSASSPKQTVSTVHSLRPHREGAGIAMAAASCAQLWGKPSYRGITRAVEAAGGQLSAFLYQGDLGYAQNSYRSCYRLSPDYFADRFSRFLEDPHFRALREQTPTGFTIDDHDYGANDGSADSVLPWTIGLWNRFHADPTNTGYYDFRLGDVHCITLDGRRYSDSSRDPNRPGKTKLGAQQRSWLEQILTSSTAELFVIFSADIFASRSRSLDCFLFGWPHEYSSVMTSFMDAQLRGKRVVVISGDAHGLRIHHHPDPLNRPDAQNLAVVEFVCAGLEARTWSGAQAGDGTLDQSRNVLGRSGLGLITVDPPGDAQRTVVLRAIASHLDDPVDLFQPLRLPFSPTPDGRLSMGSPPKQPSYLRPLQHE